MAMKKRRWIIDGGKANEHMRRVMNNLYKYAKGKGLTYISATILIDEDSDYVGIRTKSDEIVISDEHCFKEIDKGAKNL